MSRWAIAPVFQLLDIRRDPGLSPKTFDPAPLALVSKRGEGEKTHGDYANPLGFRVWRAAKCG
jgi:hypothetical protein